MAYTFKSYKVWKKSHTVDTNRHIKIKVRRKNESGDRESKISPKGQSHHQVEETLPAGVLVTCNQ